MGRHGWVYFVAFIEKFLFNLSVSLSLQHDPTNEQKYKRDFKIPYSGNMHRRRYIIELAELAVPKVFKNKETQQARALDIILYLKPAYYTSTVSELLDWKHLGNVLSIITFKCWI